MGSRGRAPRRRRRRSTAPWISSDLHAHARRPRRHHAPPTRRRRRLGPALDHRRARRARRASAAVLGAPALHLVHARRLAGSDRDLRARQCATGRGSSSAMRRRRTRPHRTSDWTIELYDLAKDPTEATNLPSSRPDVVARLLGLIRAAHRPAPFARLPYRPRRVKTAFDTAPGRRSRRRRPDMAAARGAVLMDSWAEVPGARYLMGSEGPEAHPEEGPVREVEVAAFALDTVSRHQCTVRRLRRRHGASDRRRTLRLVVRLHLLRGARRRGRVGRRRAVVEGGRGRDLACPGGTWLDGLRA